MSYIGSGQVPELCFSQVQVVLEGGQLAGHLDPSQSGLVSVRGEENLQDFIDDFLNIAFAGL